MVTQVLEGSHALSCQCFIVVGRLAKDVPCQPDEHDAGAQFGFKGECIEVC